MHVFVTRAPVGDRYLSLHLTLRALYTKLRTARVDPRVHGNLDTLTIFCDLAESSSAV